MQNRHLLIVTIIISFALLGAFIFVNDRSYRADTDLRDIQVGAYEVYTDWYRYIGIIRGLPSTTEGLERSLQQANLYKARTVWEIQELKDNTRLIDAEARGDIDAFLSIVKAGLDLGQEIVNTGYDLLAQEDLPDAYREGRVPLSNLMGKDVMELMGSNAAYHYFQLIRMLKGLNSLFDRMFTSRLDDLLRKISDRMDRIRRSFFIIRLAILGGVFVSFAFLVSQLFALNRYLREMARKTSMELTSTKSHLHEVQGYLRDAQYQQSLFEMTAGVSHELNSPLGNSIMASTYLEELIKGVKERLEDRPDAYKDMLGKVRTGEETLGILKDSLNQMKFQIDTFKRLSSVNEETFGGRMPLSEYAEDEISRLARTYSPLLVLRVNRDLGSEGGRNIRSAELNVILAQLLENSRDHSKAKEASVDINTDGDVLRISYEDDGFGVDEDAIHRIAEPFYTTARGRRHMGLGLPIIVSLIRSKLSGNIKFTSGGRGLRIDIDFPMESLGPG